MLFDALIPFTYYLSPSFFWISIPVIVLLEALVLWGFKISSLP